MTTGTLYIIAAPSGAGKTSLVKQLADTLDNLTVSISHTTRQARPGEVDGQDYYFISVPTFEAMLKTQAFVEHAQVFDNFYGTAQQTVATNLAKGLDVILEIDWQGAQQIRSIFPDSVSIFILPPSTDVLRQRLTNRAQDDEQTIARRMRDAVTEMQHHNEFDYLIVNDVFEQALGELTSILIAQRLRLAKQHSRLNTLLSSLLSGR
ncbi:guanylate kinase [Crenothrix polyspora]|uniref:Guanylate kinase n=1 Tax=Crenothrix polyspora TaxID=360316 RepID=A0A1R4HJ12_9GAMM|nr:guanylate kinase [Crenothrix polyspora]SJM96216.1 guanylate kinase [Crenothrix polyspora]